MRGVGFRLARRDAPAPAQLPRPAVVVLAAARDPARDLRTRSNERRDLDDEGRARRLRARHARARTRSSTGRRSGAARWRLARDYAQDTGGRVVVVDRRGSRVVDTAPPAPSARLRDAAGDRARRCAGEVASGIAPLGARSAPTCSTSPSRSPRAASCTAPCASRTRPRRVDARIRRYWLAARGDRGRRARRRRARRRRARALDRRARSRGSRRPPRRSARATSRRARARSTGPPEVRALAATFNDDGRQARRSSCARRTRSSPTPRTSCARR